MSYHIGLRVLRAKIRGFQAAGSTIASRISKSEKDRKNRLWNEKRLLGVHCRAHLVAYGLLRGVPYDQIEKCAPNNKLNPQLVLDIMLAHNGWDAKRGYVKYDLAVVEKLLAPASNETGSVQESPTVVAAPAASPNSGVVHVVKSLLGLSARSQTAPRSAQ